VADKKDERARSRTEARVKAFEARMQGAEILKTINEPATPMMHMCSQPLGSVLLEELTRIRKLLGNIEKILYEQSDEPTRHELQGKLER